MKKHFLLFLLASSYLSAGVCCSKQKPPTDASDKYTSDDIQAVSQKCSKCNELCDTVEVVPFCPRCNIQICFDCDSSFCWEGELAVDQESQHFFVRTTCVVCHQSVELRAIKGSVRHAIVVRRINKGGSPKIFLKETPPFDQ
jgi:hypothetical protein